MNVPFRSCQQVRETDSLTEDGEYLIQLPDFNISALYCHNMASSPSEYISLPIGLENSSNVAMYKHNDYHFGITSFQKIRFNIQVRVSK